MLLKMGVVPGGGGALKKNKAKKMVKFEALPFFNTQMKPELRYSFRLGKISLINSIRTLFTNYVCF